jgi:hypothetical protein
VDVYYTVKPFLGNSCKQVPASNSRGSAGNRVFYGGPCRELKDNWSKYRQSCVEAGSNTSTVALRVIRGDEEGSLESETVKYGHKSHGLGS